MEDQQNVFAIQGLGKRYRGASDFAVRGIDIVCRGAEIVGLLGLNGAGKSTVIKCLTGFLPFEEGRIEICGHDIVTDAVAAKRCFGYVPDNRAVFARMTGREYLNFVADVYRVGGEDRKKRTEELSEVFGLGAKVDQLIESYSHGMRQKICLIAALIHRPRLWILDEPLTGLDPQSAKALREYMKAYKAEGNTVLYSSHNLDAVEKTCDRAVIIKQGTILADVDIKKFVAEKGKSLEEAFIDLFEG